MSEKTDTSTDSMARLVKRLETPPFGTDTSERRLMELAAKTIQQLSKEKDQAEKDYGKIEDENIRLRVQINWLKNPPKLDEG